jgi:hypothetical protein
MLTKKDYQDALNVQSACNLSGVIKSFAEVMKKIFDEGFNEHKGTDWINQHPICRLYAEQIAFLTGSGTPSNGESYRKAYQEAESQVNQ